ncbi:MAG TPA: HAD-IA family hydrolase, partial [Gemmatimonadales bacterium]|nr:HAD-IA family hydrolase [Gemmatimonadales bacterium]
DAVIVGLDPAFDYGRLASGMSAVAQGARLIATNADARYPTPAGFLPGAGSIVASLAAATGVTPEVIGKPEPAMFRAIIEASGIPAAETVVVGDNPASDIVGARRAGCASILVLTGVADATGAAALIEDAAPDAVADDPAAVRVLLEPLVS